MRESVKLDLKGETHIDFDEDTFTFVKIGYSRLQLPTRIGGRQVSSNKPIAYRDIRWIGAIVMRQFWLLMPGIFFTLMGPIWIASSLGDWGPFAVSVVWFLFLGLCPILLFARGRPYLGIATERDIVIVPMDRQRKKIARILGLLQEPCPSPPVSWNLNGTSFENTTSWDSRPPTGKPFDQKRYLRITTLISLYGMANLAASIPSLRPLGITLGCAVTAVSLIWAVQAALRVIRK